MLWIIIGVAVAVLLAFVLYGRFSYLRRMFSAGHFEEVHSVLLSLLQQARDSGESTRASVGGPSAAATSCGLIVGVTRRIEGDAQVIHISLSQRRTPTTSAVANRFGFFLVTVLNRNRLDLDLFLTTSRVHHLVFAGKHGPLATNDFATTFRIYETSYRPMPFKLRTVDQMAADT